MAGSGIRWIKPPKQMAANLKKYRNQARAAVHGKCAYVGQKMQDEARIGARWQDRSGNARGGIFFAVDGMGLKPVKGTIQVRDAGGKFASGETMHTGGQIAAGDKEVILILGHTMWYGSSLELDHGGRYAIIMRTVEANLPVLQALLDGLFKD